MASIGCIRIQAVIWLACAERDDASDGIVRRDPHGNPIARNNFDTETAHPAAELGQHFVAGVTLHAVKPSAMHGHDGALHINQIVLAQLLANPFIYGDKHCATQSIWLSSYLVIWSLIE
jgi:hypothetical protein